MSKDTKSSNVMAGVAYAYPSETTDDENDSDYVSDDNLPQY